MGSYVNTWVFIYTQDIEAYIVKKSWKQFTFFSLEV